MAEEAMTFMVEDARLIFRNFAGKEGQYNREGDRNFSVILDPETAERMLADGWNVKMLASREDDEPDTPYIQISVNFKNRPPRVVMLTNDGKTRTHLDEDSVDVLDWAEFRTVDLIARAYHWVVGDKSGVKAYLQSMFATVEEDALERKYATKKGE